MGGLHSIDAHWYSVASTGDRGDLGKSCKTEIESENTHTEYSYNWPNSYFKHNHLQKAPEFENFMLHPKRVKIRDVFQQFMIKKYSYLHPKASSTWLDKIVP